MKIELGIIVTEIAIEVKTSEFGRIILTEIIAIVIEIKVTKTHEKQVDVNKNLYNIENGYSGSSK